jgi:O-acetyl-ADP-ribose deacetylase (regulator of RNase III)
MKYPTKIFISYKTGVDDGLTYTANSLRRELRHEGYEVWMDETGLESGKDWNEQIYQNIAACDILLLLLGHTTVNSDWVRREVDVARGAKVCVLPVLIREKFDKQDALNRFDLPRMQYVTLLTGSDDQFAKLLEAIRKREGETLSKQMEWLAERQKKSKGTQAKPHKKDYASFVLDLGYDLYHRCNVHIAVGDVMRMENIDVVVNSENDFLQMARIFESKTMSALLRYYGSLVDEGGHLIEDTVQDELNRQLFNWSEITTKASKSALPSQPIRPVGIGTVIPTSSGHPRGRLYRRNKFRYIFHTAAVSVDGEGIERKLEPARDDSSIRRCVVHTLETVQEVDNMNGIISPEGTPQNDEQKTLANSNRGYREIRSIILPMFASGHGGRSVREVMKPIVEGVYDFLRDNTPPTLLEELKRKEADAKKKAAKNKLAIPDPEENAEESTDELDAAKPPLRLRDIYLSIFYEEDIEPMIKTLEDQGFKRVNR